MISPRVPLLRKQLITTIDKATTMVCLDCSGQVRALGEQFDTLAGSFDHPPFHRWCRTVVRPALPEMVDDQRSQANAEIGRRPLKERRKGPGGVGARIPPPPHAATLERRVPTAEVHGYEQLYDRLLPAVDQAHNSAISRYLADTELDCRLRAGSLRPEDLSLVSDLDAAIGAGQISEQVTVFTALDRRVSDSLKPTDIVSDDSYLDVSMNPAVAGRYGHPLALTLPMGLPAVGLDRDTQRLLLARRHSWRLLALGLILVAVLL